MPPSPLPNTSYTLAWICALREEYDVAIAILDELHGIPQHQPLEDRNAYLLGRIGAHNVVMVCLPAGRMGTAAAAAVAENLCRTFRSVRYGLLVGIGGGVPGGRDIRLGDVVVSVPGGGYGGVVQYDLGDGDVYQGQLNSPPEKLLAYVTLVNTLMRSPRIAGNCFCEQLELLGEEYEYPVHLEDRLFCSGYSHQFEKGGCEACDVNCGEVYRKKRESALPAVHLGMIASGNTVIGDGVTRDKISHRYKSSILCFEMEAAGVMNTLPCLVVRGISDYADSSKNDEWRPRAIAAACCYAKAFVLHIPPEEAPQPSEMAHVTDRIKDMRAELAHIKTAIVGLWSLQKDTGYRMNHAGDHRLATILRQSMTITTSLTRRLAYSYYGLIQVSQYLRLGMSLFFRYLKRHIWSMLPGQPPRDNRASPSGALPSVLSIQGWGWHLITEPQIWYPRDIY